MKVTQIKHMTDIDSISTQEIEKLKALDSKVFKEENVLVK